MAGRLKLTVGTSAGLGLAKFLDDKQKYRTVARSSTLNDRLRRLEELQVNTYEILRIREANGGRPISPEWQRWAKAQEDLGLTK